MTKEEILNGMSEQEFYSLYPTKEAWEQAQSQMAYGGSPFIQGFPFGAGITMAHGGTPYYGGPLYPAQAGVQSFDTNTLAYTGANAPTEEALMNANLTTFGNNEWANQAGDTRFIKNIGTPVAPFSPYGKQSKGRFASNPNSFMNTGTPGANTSMNTSSVTDQQVDTKVRSKIYPTIQQGGVNWPKFKTPSEYDRFIERDPNLSLYSPEDLEALGLVKPEGPNLKAIAKQEIQAARLAQQQAFMEAQARSQEQPLTNERHGGAPCYNCGGYMQEGGTDDMAALWLAAEQAALQKRTKQGLPAGVKPTGTNPLNYNPFIKGSDIAEIDSIHTNPYNPNIAAYFKGNKMIAGPSTNTGPAINAARKANTGKFYKKDNEIYTNYMNQSGGSMTQDLQGKYPVFGKGGYDTGGPSPFNYGQFPAMSHGGDTTKQGGNEDFLNNRKGSYMSFIQNNVLKNMHKEESEKVQNAYMQMEQGMHQMPDGSMMPNNMMQVGGGPGMSYGYNAYDAPNMDNQYKQQMYQAKINSYKDQHAQDRENMFGANQMLAANIDQNLAARGAFSNALDQLGNPTAQKGGTAQEQADWNAAMAQGEDEMANYTATRKAEHEKELYDYLQGLKGQGRQTTNTSYQQNTNQESAQQNMPWFKQLAEEFGPQSRTNGLNYFPANLSKYYKMNKAGKEAFVNLPENFKTKGIEITRTKGPLGRTWLGKKMGIGDKKINIKLSGTSDWANSPYEQGPQVRLSDPTNPLLKPYSQTSTGAPIGTYETQSGSFAPPAFDLGKDRTPMAYGGDYYAQEGRSVLGPNPMGMPKGISLKGAPPATSFVAAPGPIDYKTKAGIKDPYESSMGVGESGTDNIDAEADITPAWAGWKQTLGQYAIPGMNMLANKFEQKDLRASQARLDQGMLADNAMVRKPGNAFDMGTYNVNSGDFRENQKVPVQYPGYAQWGGFNTMQMGGGLEEGEELDLSPEEIEDLRAQGYDVEFLD